MIARSEHFFRFLHHLSAVVIVISALASQDLPAEPPKTAEPSAVPPDQPRHAEGRTDRYGDPLPPRVIARLGTLRFRGIQRSMAFSPDGKCLASETEGGVTLWETATGRAIRKLDAPAMHLCFSADGKRLACSNNLLCHIVDISNGKKLFTIYGTYGTFADDGKTLTTANVFISPWRVEVWDAGTGRHLRRWAAGEGIQELDLSANGRMAAWINQNKPVVQIRDLENGTVKHSISIGANSRPQFAFAPDGKRLAIADGRQVGLWDIAAGKQIRRWDQRSDSRPVFSRDGRRLAWAGYDNEMGIARIWTVERDEDAPHALGTPVNSFAPPCWSPDGKFLAVLTDGHALQLRQLGDGKEILPLDAHDSPVGRVVFSADGRHVVSCSRTGFFVWETHTGRLVRRAPEAEWQGAGLHRLVPEGRLLTTDEESGLLAVRDLETGREVWRFAARLNLDPLPFVLAPGGRYVAAQGRAGEIRVLDVRTGRCSYRLDLQGANQGLRLSADGDVLVGHRVTSSGIEVEVHRQAAKKMLLLRDFPKDRRLSRCLESWDFSFLSPDGRWLVLPTEDGRLHRWDLLSGKEASPLTEARRTSWELVWSPEGRFVAAQGSASPANRIDNSPDARKQQDLRVWDVRTGLRLPHLTVPNPHGGMHVLFSHDERMMLTTDLQGVIHLWEIATSKERGQLRGHLPYEIGALTLSADGRMLLSGGYDSQGFVWDLTGHMVDGQWRRATNTPEQRRGAWEALASTDAKAAYRVLWQLAADPEGTIAFLSEQVRPIVRPDPKQVSDWLAALDSAEFVERERAMEELAKRGGTVAAELRKTLTQKPTLEVRRRIELLLEKLEGLPQGRELQALRALEVLEQIGTPEARALLRKLSRGATGARLTQEAGEALARSEKVSAP